MELAILLGIFLLEYASIIGVLLPGDTLLLNIGVEMIDHSILYGVIVTLAIILTVFIGSIVGYKIAKKFNRNIISHINKFVTQDKIDKCISIIENYGYRKTILISKFLPSIRSIVVQLLGMSKIKYKEYVIYSLLSSIIWPTTIILLGYIIGKLISPSYTRIISYSLIIAAVVVTIISILKYRVNKKSKKN